MPGTPAPQTKIAFYLSSGDKIELGGASRDVVNAVKADFKNFSEKQAPKIGIYQIGSGNECVVRWSDVLAVRIS